MKPITKLYGDELDACPVCKSKTTTEANGCDGVEATKDDSAVAMFPHSCSCGEHWIVLYVPVEIRLLKKRGDQNVA